MAFPQAWRRQSGGSVRHRLPVYPSAAQALRGGTLQSPAGRPRRPPNRRSTAPKPALYNVEKSVSGANATVPIRLGAAAGLRAVTARSTRNSALLVSFFAALPSGLPSGGSFTTISLCFLQPARS